MPKSARRLKPCTRRWIEARRNQVSADSAGIQLAEVDVAVVKVGRVLKPVVVELQRELRVETGTRLRRPLQVVQGHLEVVRRGVLAAKQRAGRHRPRHL